MKLFLFSDAYPYGDSETFLENEVPFLCREFDQVIVIPLQKKNGKRAVPDQVKTWLPILDFGLKDKTSLLKAGLFNFIPFHQLLGDFFSHKVYLNKYKIWNFFTSLLLFRAILSNKKFWNKMWTEIDDDDLVYFYWGDKSALAIPHIKRHKRNKIFVRFHRTDLYEYARHGYIPFRKNIFSHTDHFLPISNDGKEYLLNHYPSLITPEKTEICRLGVFDRGSNPPQTDKAAFHLLSCSYVVPVKRLPLIIDTLKRISVPLKWTHIGSGPLFKDIQDQAKTLPSNIEVNFKGALTNAEVIRYYQENHIDLFLNVSSSEGIPVSIMEALSFGIPVLATDVGGTREIMDEKTGRLIHVNTSAAEIADQINALIQSDTDALRKNARQRWEERCNAEKNYKDFIKFLKTNQ